VHLPTIAYDGIEPRVVCGPAATRPFRASITHYTHTHASCFLLVIKVAECYSGQLTVIDTLPALPIL
jgi:hypothetical protein